jgi:hypothetical protein
MMRHGAAIILHKKNTADAPSLQVCTSWFCLFAKRLLWQYYCIMADVLRSFEVVLEHDKGILHNNLHLPT